MNNFELKKAQMIQLEIAKEIKRICIKNKIKYSLGYGTLIGAIRHKGFIPWDDDLDICFLRKEYDRFIAACKTDLGEKFFLQTYETDPYYTWPYAKIQMKGTVYKEAGVNDKMACGVFVDLFPFENAPVYTVPVAIFKYRFYLKLLQIKMGYSETISKNKKVLRFLMRLLSKFYSVDCLKKKVTSIPVSYKNDHSRYVYDINSESLIHAKLPRKVFKKYCTAVFEDDSFMIIKEYDAYLRYFYGDYMQLPPESERENRHCIVEFSYDNDEEEN